MIKNTYTANSARINHLVVVTKLSKREKKNKKMLERYYRIKWERNIRQHLVDIYFKWIRK